ncbi:MAG: thermonuclease family protein [Deltaproteobacteria bacterium]|nr:thermonuclease family protein [Deltaproteobacteria bacterium]
MAGHQGVAIVFVCLFILGPGPFPAAAGDAARSSPVSGKSGAKRAPEAAGIQTPARVLSVYDGDTVKVEADMWPGLTWKGSVRVEGVDTPELRGKCDGEKRKARAARDFVRERVGKRVTLMDVKKGKYAGRVVARIRLADGTDLTELLIRARHGRAYDGGRRRGWCGKDGK